MSSETRILRQKMPIKSIQTAKLHDLQCTMLCNQLKSSCKHLNGVRDEQARIEGQMQVFFYDTEAGVTEVNAKYARSRAVGKSPYILEVGHCSIAAP